MDWFILLENGSPPTGELLWQQKDKPLARKEFVPGSRIVFLVYNILKNKMLRRNGYRLFSLLILLGSLFTPLVVFSSANPSVSAQFVEDLQVIRPVRFEHLSNQEGLSQSSVYGILQDRLGFMWFGTEDGLNRYDGYQFKVYKPIENDSTSLSDRWITALVADQDGSLWVGTRLGGVNHFDPQTGTFTRFLHDPNDPTSLSSNNVLSLLQDHSGVLWIGTSAGLDQLDSQTNTFIHYKHRPRQIDSLSNDYVNVIYEDSNEVLWVGTSDGLNWMNRTTGTFQYYRYDPVDPGSLRSNFILDIYEDKQGALWIGTNRGLERMDIEPYLFTHFKPEQNNPNSLSDNLVLVIYEDRFGTLWIGTRNGLNSFDSERTQITRYLPDSRDPFSLSNESIRSIYEDQAGAIWIGTFGGGVNKLDRSRMKFSLLQNLPEDPNSLGNNLVFKLFAAPDDTVWIATFGGGVDALNLRNGQFTHYRHDPNQPTSLIDDHVWSVYEDRIGKLWVGTENGLDLLDEWSGKFKHFQPDPKDPASLAGNVVYTALEDSQGHMWFGTNNGLERFDRITQTFIHYQNDPQNSASLSDNEVVCIFETREGQLWLGTFYGGLERFDPQTGKFEHYQHDLNNPDSLGSDSVLSIYQDRNGNLWIGTAGGGLDKLNQTDNSTGTGKVTFTHYTESDGLSNNVVNGILEDKLGNLWLSTNNGLSSFDPQNETFKNYDARDGLQSNEFNMNSYTRTLGGIFFFGGTQGINFFIPEEMSDNLYVPPLVFTGLSQAGEPIRNDQTVETMQELTLRWPGNYFEFEFAALSFTNPIENQYAYRLEKFDKEWVYLGTRRYGRYTNLPGGAYTLRIIGSNNDGVWNEIGATLRIKVVPPFWQTWWFQGSFIALVFASVYTGYRLRLRSVVSRSRDLEQQVQERTQEIERLFEETKELAIIEERNRLARDLHDSAKQKAFAALAQLGAARSMIKTDLAGARIHLEEAENLVTEVIQELTFLIQEMYPLALKEKGLIAVLREYIYEWEDRSGIQVKLDVDGDKQLPLQIEQALYRIIQEALANIARHSGATLVDIHLDYLCCADQFIDLVIEDNGCGFDLTQKPTGVGLRSMRERAAMIHGEFEIVSNCGDIIKTGEKRGTRIHVRAPFTLPESENIGGKNGEK
jgi:ligand-binding sensor domain-containing protein/signal transduction histidine kinase